MSSKGENCLVVSLKRADQVLCEIISWDPGRTMQSGSWKKKKKKLASAFSTTRRAKPSTACVDIAIIKHAEEGEGVKERRGRITIFLTTLASLTDLASLHHHTSSIDILTLYLTIFPLFPSYSWVFPFLVHQFPPGFTRIFSASATVCTSAYHSLTAFSSVSHLHLLKNFLVQYDCTYHLNKPVHTQHVLTLPAKGVSPLLPFWEMSLLSIHVNTFPIYFFPLLALPHELCRHQQREEEKKILAKIHRNGNKTKIKQLNSHSAHS